MSLPEPPTSPLPAHDAQLQQLFNAGPLPAVLYALQDGRILDINVRFLEAFEATREEAIGKTGWELGIWCELEQRNRLVAQVRETGQVRDFEARFRTKRGRELEMILSARLIDFAGGPAVIVQGNDVTERNQFERRLRENESRYRSVVEGSLQGILIHQDQHICFANSALARMFDFAGPEELIGRPLWDTFVLPENRAELEDRTRRLLNGEAVPPHPGWRAAGKTGRAIWVATSASRIEWQGRPAIVAFYLDVSEQKRAEAALRDSESRLRTVLETLDNVAVQAYESDGTITFWNRASERLYGYSAAEALGRDVVELLHAPAARPEERRMMAEAIATRRLMPAEEIEVVSRDGRRLWVFASRILHARPGRQPEFFCFDVDITGRRQAEEELALRQTELLHAARLSSLGQMVAALSHEVAQPLSAIANFAAASATLLETSPSDSWSLLQDYNQAIGKQALRCGAILTRLRTFSSRSATQRSAGDINHLLRESAELMAHELRHDNIQIRFELAEGLPLVVCDRVQLEQVVVNLLTNARDALRDQAPQARWITLRSLREAGFVCFEVADQGSGLAPDVAPRLFEPFVTTKASGMGIGLSICRTILRAHGGQIEAQPNPGGGALFRVRLPVQH